VNDVVVVGITGASGAVYAVRLIDQLARAGMAVHVVVSKAGRRVMHDEMGAGPLNAEALSSQHPGQITIHHEGDFGAVIASGSFLHRGMVVVPCSSGTLAAIANGVTTHLVHRAAAVTLKERRRLILCFRETPLSHVDIVNFKLASEAGAIVMPLAPGFYMAPKSIDDLLDFMTGRVMDLLGVPHTLPVRWGQKP
jgi:4-hydroxy-3-polyprenylbenzoate decarboxylase